MIGIHFGCNKQKTTNYGTFIGFIIDKLNSNEYKINVTKSSAISDYSNNSSGTKNYIK